MVEEEEDQLGGGARFIGELFAVVGVLQVGKGGHANMPCMDGDLVAGEQTTADRLSLGLVLGEEEIKDGVVSGVSVLDVRESVDRQPLQRRGQLRLGGRGGRRGGVGGGEDGKVARGLCGQGGRGGGG